jgi:hypothetical protein
MVGLFCAEISDHFAKKTLQEKIFKLEWDNLLEEFLGKKGKNKGQGLNCGGI